jgi:hypothetical protein
MPIIGLTDRGAQFPRIGELRKGAPKPATGNKPGADLKHFRFTSTNQDVVQTFGNAYGNEPTAVKIFLPYATTDENFEAWIEEWGAGSLKWRGDGQNLVIWQTAHGTYSHEPKPQPEKGGKQVGRLKVIIPELGRLAYVVALTTSTHDIMELHSNLTAYEAMAGGLQGIPFILSRVPRMVSTPGKNGRVRREKWLLHIEAAPEWVQAQLATMQQSALPQYHEPLAIGDGEPDEFDVDEDGVIIPQEPEPTPEPERSIQRYTDSFLQYCIDNISRYNGANIFTVRNALKKQYPEETGDKKEMMRRFDWLKAHAAERDAEEAEALAVEQEPLFDESGNGAYSD